MNLRRSPDDLSQAIADVVANENCSGCGACAQLSADVSMQLNPAGYLRPTLAGPVVSRDVVDRFRSSCPGVRVVAPTPPDVLEHPIFGRYLSAWEGWAIDPVVREAGSSGGVITAISQHLLSQSTHARGSVVMADPSRPERSVVVNITTKEEALAAAGSRYNPVGGCATPSMLGSDDIFVGKPCEVAAANMNTGSRPASEGPLLVSFFCAGTPSQNATNQLVENLGVDLQDLLSLRYRGDGWPGRFTAVSASSPPQSMSYQESWGGTLGKSVQWRCKVCPDGTGQLSDITVGDYWETDSSGFPIFESAAGRSAVICRTERGHQLLLELLELGLIYAHPLDLDLVAKIQPLQEDRRVTMVGRIVGSRLAGRKTPSFPGFNLLRLAARHPIRNMKAALGTFLRVKGRRK